MSRDGFRAEAQGQHARRMRVAQALAVMEDMLLPAAFSPRRTDAADSRMSPARRSMRTIIEVWGRVLSVEYAYGAKPLAHVRGSGSERPRCCSYRHVDGGESRARPDKSFLHELCGASAEKQREVGSEMQ